MDYEKLYNTYYMQVFSYVMTLAKNKDLAEEITQNVFYKALSTRADFRKGSSELTWLCSIARNTFYDEMRRQQHISDLPQSDDQPSGEDVEKSITDADATYRIHMILHNLDEPYKEIFSLRVFGELPFSQIASIFGKTESWARVTYHRARLKIQERMDNNYE
ncbi:MAG: RNA polymerase sigma factor [Coprococcus sp.]